MGGIGSQEYYEQLVGMKVVEAGFTDLDESGQSFPFLILQGKGEKVRVEVSQDEEGNGPGFLFISTAKEKP
jgi:hypothetical protein